MGILSEILRTADPVMDAERYANRKDPRPSLGECPVCGETVHDKCEGWLADDGYIIYGVAVHEDCLKEFLDNRGCKI